jgi:hypothetical protein
LNWKDLSMWICWKSLSSLWGSFTLGENFLIQQTFCKVDYLMFWPNRNTNWNNSNEFNQKSRTRSNSTSSRTNSDTSVYETNYSESDRKLRKKKINYGEAFDFTKNAPFKFQTNVVFRWLYSFNQFYLYVMWSILRYNWTYNWSSVKCPILGILPLIWDLCDF